MSEFMLGCNYWDSVSGTDMWRKWNKDVVEDDLKALHECGVKYLRVFPLWRDFQPVKKLYRFRNMFGEYVFGDEEKRLDNNPNGISMEMVEHFRDFADIAKKYDMKLIVSIVTGWMSGRMFVPPAIEGRKLITDSEVLMWANRFITGLVKEIKDIDNIVMWDLGNECNSMQLVTERTDAYMWTAFIRNSIKVSDNTRPISSGMHGLTAEEHDGVWHLADQGELCDMVTTHPYPSPTVNCDMEPMNRIRTTIVPTAQSEFYSGISGKPCMIQEQGSFAPSMGNRKMSSEFMRVNLLSAWANNLIGYLWWCGMEHLRLKKAPYSWAMNERELGLVDVGRKPKLIGEEMRRIGEVLKYLPNLAPKDIDAVCVLPMENRQVKAIGTYILAKQAGFNIKFTNSIPPDADAYVVPCMEFWGGMNEHVWDKLLERVENYGADLLITFSGCAMTEFERVTGLTSNGYRETLGARKARFKFGEISYHSKKELILESIGAEVLAENEEGNIVFSRNKLGKGYVYFLNFNLETMAYNKPEGFNPEMTEPYYKIYEIFGEKLRKNYVVQTDNPYIGITQSKNEDGSYIVTAINYSDEPQKPDAVIKEGYKIETLYGNLEVVDKCDAVIMKAVK